MSANANLVRRYFAEVVDGRSDVTLDELFAPDCRIIRADRTRPLVGIKKLRRFVRASLRAVPAIETEILELVDDGAGQVVVCVNHEARFGPVVITPLGLTFAQGRTARWQAFAMFTIESGKIVSERVIRDEISILRSLGVIGQTTLWGRMMERMRSLFKRGNDVN